jgi:hypothetical protein
MQINVATVPLVDLHQVVAHAVAEGRAPDLAVRQPYAQGRSLQYPGRPGWGRSKRA